MDTNEPRALSSGRFILKLLELSILDHSSFGTEYSYISIYVSLKEGFPKITKVEVESKKQCIGFRNKEGESSRDGRESEIPKVFSS